MSEAAAEGLDIARVGPATTSARAPAAAARGSGPAERAAHDAAVTSAARDVLLDQVPDARRVELGRARVAALASGERVARLAQVHGGVPVLDRGASVAFTADGTPRLAAARLETALPSSTQPAVGKLQAVAAARRVVWTPNPPRTRLAVWPARGGRPTRLVWVVAFPASPAFPSAPVVLVDAASGEVVARADAARRLNLGRVYPTNPVTTPELTEVTLPVAEGASTLQNALVEAYNCIDQKAVSKLGETAVHVCTPVQTAQADDASHDFLSIEAAPDQAPEDAFAEIAAFHHVARVYDYFRTLQPDFVVQEAPVTAIANFRVPEGFGADAEKQANPDLPLVPLSNAFATPGGEPLGELHGVDGMAIWLGQGAAVDFSYDGDVVYHEFTHLVVFATANLSPYALVDEQGATFSPGAMNEGIADYFAAAISGDPHIGEHASKEFAEGGAIRSIDTDASCPSAVVGEPHYDSTMFSSALWKARKSVVPAERQAFDVALLTALQTAPTGDLGFDELASLMLESVAASPLGPAAAQGLESAFEKRGLLPRCERVVKYEGEPISGPGGGYWTAPGLLTAGLGGIAGEPPENNADLPYVPGVVQVRVRLPEGTEQLEIRFEAAELSASLLGAVAAIGRFEPYVLVRFGGEPIRFSFSPLAEEGDTMLAEPDADGKDHTASVPVPAGTETVHVMVVNFGEADGLYGALAFAKGEPAPSTGATLPVPRGGGVGFNRSGCTCAVPPSSSGHAGALLAAAAGACAASWRRRASRGQRPRSAR